MATEDRTVIVIDENEFEDQNLQEKLPCPVTKMSVAASGLYIACFRQDGVLSVMSTSFTSNVRLSTVSISRFMGCSCLILIPNRCLGHSISSGVVMMPFYSSGRIRVL